MQDTTTTETPAKADVVVAIEDAIRGKRTRTRKAPAKAAPAKAAPAKKSAAPKAAPKAPAKAKAERAPKVKNYTLPAGYAVRWPHGGYDTLKKIDSKVEGPAWQITCNDHGEMTEIKTVKDGDALGRKADRATWCGGCKKAAKKG